MVRKIRMTSQKSTHWGKDVNTNGLHFNYLVWFFLYIAIDKLKCFTCMVSFYLWFYKKLVFDWPVCLLLSIRCIKNNILNISAKERAIRVSVLFTSCGRAHANQSLNSNHVSILFDNGVNSSLVQRGNFQEAIRLKTRSKETVRGLFVEEKNFFQSRHYQEKGKRKKERKCHQSWSIQC